MLLTENGAIAPHGRGLVDRAVAAGEREERLKEAAGLPKVTRGPRMLSNLGVISTGVSSPLEGFMGQEEFDRVPRDNEVRGTEGGDLPALRGKNCGCTHFIVGWGEYPPPGFSRPEVVKIFIEGQRAEQE